MRKKYSPSPDPDSANYFTICGYSALLTHLLPTHRSSVPSLTLPIQGAKARKKKAKQFIFSNKNGRPIFYFH